MNEQQQIEAVRPLLDEIQSILASDKTFAESMKPLETPALTSQMVFKEACKVASLSGLKNPKSILLQCAEWHQIQSSCLRQMSCATDPSLQEAINAHLRFESACREACDNE